jgi:hypothetical protein
MKKNDVFDHALCLLIQPIPLAAIGLYALNTLVLQRVAPNWLTGKLGDFCWIIVAPIALTAILSLLLPGRSRKYAFSLSILMTALIFGLIKATSLNTLVLSSLAGILGRPISILQDKSDLLAMPALAVTFLLWNRPQARIKTNRSSGILMIGLLTLMMIADAAPPKLGVTSIEFADKTILACGGYSSNMQSNDGGQTWQASQEECKERLYSPLYEQTIQDPRDEKIQYRFSPSLIERSIDSGLTWQSDYRWDLPTEAEQLYAITSKQDYNANFQPPFSGAVDPATGEVFFAMGNEGILKRDAGATPNYHWLAVGDYQVVTFQKSDMLFALLTGEWMLALCAGGAGVILLDIRLKRSKVKTALLILGLIGMAAFAILFPPAPTLAEPYLGQFLSIGLMLLSLWMLVLTAIAFHNVWMNSKRQFFLSMVGFVIIVILALAPYSLWVYNIIPHYQTARLAAGVVSVVSIIGLYVLGSRMAPVKRLQP